MDARVERWFQQRGEDRPAGMPTAVSILNSCPRVVGLAFGATACGASRGVGTIIDHIADSAAQGTTCQLTLVQDSRAVQSNERQTSRSDASAVRDATSRGTEKSWLALSVSARCTYSTVQYLHTYIHPRHTAITVQCLQTLSISGTKSVQIQYKIKCNTNHESSFDVQLHSSVHICGLCAV